MYIISFSESLLFLFDVSTRASVHLFIGPFVLSVSMSVPFYGRIQGVLMVCWKPLQVLPLSFSNTVYMNPINVNNTPCTHTYARNQSRNMIMSVWQADHQVPYLRGVACGKQVLEDERLLVDGQQPEDPGETQDWQQDERRPGGRPARHNVSSIWRRT